MPNIQFSVPENTYIEAAQEARVFNLSTGQLAKALLKAYLDQRIDPKLIHEYAGPDNNAPTERIRGPF